jgi:hypothetical protein
MNNSNQNEEKENKDVNRVKPVIQNKSPIDSVQTTKM